MKSHAITYLSLCLSFQREGLVITRSFLFLFLHFLKINTPFNCCEEKTDGKGFKQEYEQSQTQNI